MKVQIEAEVKRADAPGGYYKVLVGECYLYSPGASYLWSAEQLEAAGLPVPPRQVTFEATLTADEADAVAATWGFALDDPNPLLTAARKVSDAVKGARS